VCVERWKRGRNKEDSDVEGEEDKPVLRDLCSWWRRSADGTGALDASGVVLAVRTRTTQWLRRLALWAQWKW